MYVYCVDTQKKQCIGVCVLCMVHIGYTIHNTHKKSGYHCMFIYKIKDLIASNGPLISREINKRRLERYKT